MLSFLSPHFSKSKSSFLLSLSYHVIFDYVISNASFEKDIFNYYIGGLLHSSSPFSYENDECGVFISEKTIC